MQSFLSTYIFVIPLVVMLLSEIAKVVVSWTQTGSWERGIFRHGGMPSSHSAFVTSLLIVVGREDGIDSTMFAIAVVFASIVFYDAVSIRHTVGRHAWFLNLLQKIHKVKVSDELYRFSERVGHSLMEVVAGVAFGVLVTTVLQAWIA